MNWKIQTGANMKISRETLSILKNFRDLNSNVLINPGNVIKTFTTTKNVMATATVEEEFPVQFGLWDLGSFLGTISLFDDPEFDFNEKYVVIRSKNSSEVKYFYSDPNLLTVPTKDVIMPETVVSISLSEERFNELKKAAAVLNLPDLSFVSNGDAVSAILSDKTNATRNTYSIDITDVSFDEGAEFNFDFKIELLRFISGSYTINIAEKVVSEFVNASGVDLRYWVALQGTSSYTVNQRLRAGAA